MNTRIFYTYDEEAYASLKNLERELLSGPDAIRDIGEQLRLRLDRYIGFREQIVLDAIERWYALMDTGVALTDDDVDRLLDRRVPGGSTVRDWLIPHDNERATHNVRTVIRCLFAAAEKLKSAS